MFNLEIITDVVVYGVYSVVSSVLQWMESRLADVMKGGQRERERERVVYVSFRSFSWFVSLFFIFYIVLVL